MTQQQGEALLNEIRALRSEVRGVRLASRLTCAVLLLAGIAVALSFHWFRENIIGATLLGTGGGCVLWLLWSVFRDMASKMKEKPEGTSPASADPAP